MRRRDRGSVLMLMPAGVLIVLLLGAISVDSAIVYLRQREAYNVAFDAANDAAGGGLDLDLLRTTGDAVYDPVRLEAIARSTIEAAQLDDLTFVAVAPDGGGVSVTVEVTVRHLFMQAFGDPSRDRLQVTARVDVETRRP